MLRPWFLTIATAAGLAAGLAAVYGIAGLARNADDKACLSALETARHIAPLARGEVAAVEPADVALQVPAFNFQDGAGRRVSLADWRGQVVLLNLWATWCVPCRKEMPALDNLQGRNLQGRLGGKPFQVIAVNIDTRDPQKPLAFLKQAGVTHLAYYSDQSAQVFETLRTAGKAFGMPTTLLVDPQGCEIGTMAGPAQWSSDDGVKLVRAIIASDTKTVTR